MRARSAISGLFLVVCLATTAGLSADSPQAPLVAIPPAILQKQAKNPDTPIKEAAELAERVQLALQSDPALEATRFVERIAVETLIREQSLSLAAGAPAETRPSDDTLPLRAGRLAHADWILRIRLRADDLARPRVQVEVIDALRADLITREETPLEQLPNESWLLAPNDTVVDRVARLATRALGVATERQKSLAAATRLAPLAFVDRSPNERLAPLASLLHAALRTPRPGIHVLGYEAENESRPESALFLAGLTDLDAAAWSRVADAYVWGEFTEAEGYSGPVAELPVNVRLWIWSDDRGPRETVVSGRFGDLPSLAGAAAEAVHAALGKGRITDPFSQRSSVARVLRDSALAMRAREPAYAARRAALSLFFDPLNPDGRETGRAILASFTGPATWSPAAVTLRRALGPDASPAPSPVSARPPTSAKTTPVSPASASSAWREESLEDLLAAAENGPVLRSPWLEPEWSVLQPASLIPAGARRAAVVTPAPLGLANGSLWLAPLPAWHPAGTLSGPGLWRLDLSPPLASALEITGFPGARVGAMDSAPDGRLWLASRDRGVIIYDPARPDKIETIGAADGLPSHALQHIYPAPGVRFFSGWQARWDTAPSIANDTREIAQTRPPEDDRLPGAGVALRAAILACGDDSPPRVRLPETPACAYELRALVSPRPPPDDRQAPAALPTGPRDGYWLANRDTVLWAAGSRRVAVARWLQGEIAALADDGRHLLIVTSRLRSLREWQTLRAEDSRAGAFALHLYDYRAGTWRGRVALSAFQAILAGEGRVLLYSAGDSPWLLADLSTLRDVPAPEEPATAPPSSRRAAPSQHSPQRRAQDQLLAALSKPAADLEAVRAALEAGAEAAPPDDGNDQPLLLAARRGHLDALTFLISQTPASAWNRQPARRPGATVPPPLGLALVRALLTAGQPELASRVVAAGAGIGYVDEPHLPSLAWLAVKCGAPDLVRALHAAGWPLGTSIEQHPLREAAAQKNAALLRQLLALVPPAKIDDASGNGQTPLFAAADAGWAEGVGILLAAGVSSYQGDSLARRSLRDAAAPWPQVSILLNRRPGAPDNQIEGSNAVALLAAGENEALASLPLPAAVLRYRDMWGWTPLHHAARLGRTGFVKRLLAAGAAPDDLTDAGESALCLSAFRGDADAFAALLSVGADVNARRGSGWPPLHAAAREGRADFVRRLLAAGADCRPLAGESASPALVLAAATPGDEESLRLLVEAGAPLEATDRDGFGPLEAAVLSDSPAKIQYLIDRGARWQKRFDENYHPVDAAARRGLTASIRKLRELGLRSPRALSLAKDDATRALLQADDSEAGRLLLLNEEQWPAVVAEPDAERRLARVRAHLAAGADPNHHSAIWGTPLDLALLATDPALVDLLVRHGADPAKKSSGLAAGQFSPRTSLHALLASRFAFQTNPRPQPANLDKLVLAWLPLFWPHEPDPDHRAEMLRWARDGGLAASAAWIQARL